MNASISSTSSAPAQRYYWVDVLRLTALLMVILSHTVDIYNATPQADSSAGFWGAFFGSLVRPSVPLFAMITGFLLLPVQGDPLAFYKKRIPRVLFPMIFWSVLYYLVPWLTGILGCDLSIVKLFYPFEYSPSQSLTDALVNIAHIPVSFNGYTTHMWYIYMLIGLYLFLPFFSAWIEKDKEEGKGKLTRIFLILWSASLLIPFLYEIFSYEILGECAWNRFGLLYYFGGFTGYLLLGHVLGKKRHSWKKSRLIPICLALYILGFVITYIGFRTLSTRYSYEEEPLLLEMFWQFCSPNVVIMAIGVFLLIRRVKVSSLKIQSALRSFTKCSFGGYLMHYIFIGPVSMAYDALGVHLPIPLLVPLIVLTVFGLCWTMAAILYKILPPKASKLILG